MPRRNHDFQAIRSEGSLLPPDPLRRVLVPKAKLDGTRPEGYGLPQGERLDEVITNRGTACENIGRSSAPSPRAYQKGNPAPVSPTTSRKMPAWQACA